MIFLEKPENFKPKFEVVSLFLFYEDEFLLLLRQKHKPMGNCWGVPAGKVDKDESKLEALQRETFEETGISLNSDKIVFQKTFFVTHKNINFIYHSFSYIADELPKVALRNEEHKKYIWTTLENSLKLKLVEDMDFVIKNIYKI